MDHAEGSPTGKGQPGEPNTVRALPLHEIDDADETFRFRSEVASGSLVQSLEKQGQLTPIKVLAAGKTYRILDGFRRTAAARVLGWKTIDAVVYPPMLAEEARRVVFVANVVRDNLTVIEKADGIQLARRKGFTKSETAEMFGISPRQIERYLALPDGMLEWIDGRRITMAHARVLANHVPAIPRNRLPELIDEIRSATVSAKDLPGWLRTRGFTSGNRKKRPRVVGSISADKVRFYITELSRSSSAEIRGLTLQFLRRAIRRIEDFDRDSVGRAVSEFENGSS